MKKNYIVDTSVLLDDENCISILRNGEENKVHIPYTVLMELNGLKKDKRLNFYVNRVVKKIEDDQNVIFLQPSDIKDDCGDLQIINEVISNKIESPIIVTNDTLFRVICKSRGVDSQEFKCSTPYESESQIFTGFQKQGEDPIPNAFTWIDGKPYFNNPKGTYELIDHTNEVWNLKPHNIYQNLALELILDDNIDLVTIQSQAGMGKSMLSLACALYKTLQEKRFSKIILVKPTVEIGESLGFLPGDIDDKLDPYTRYLINLIYKLHNMRGSKNSKIFTPDSTPSKLKLNPEIFEILPIQYIRGMNIDNSFVIIDECQNLSRLEMRSILSRMGKNVKCVCAGDVCQIDSRYLNKFNNGLNWIVKMCTGEHNYAHLVLKSDKSRGPICDMVLKTKL